METRRHPQPSIEASRRHFSRSQRVIHVRAPKPEIHQEQVQRITHRTAASFSHTTLRVLRLLIAGDLSRLRPDLIAAELGISPTTLRRRLPVHNSSYQGLLDPVLPYLC